MPEPMDFECSDCRKLREKIKERLYELRDMEGDFRAGQRSVFEWVLREIE